MSDPASSKPTPTGDDAAGPAPDIAARAAAAARAEAAAPAQADGPKPVGKDAAKDARPAEAAARPAGPGAAMPPPARPDPAAPSARAEPPASRGAGAVLTALAVALLAGGLGWVWHQQQETAAAMVAPGDVAALREQVRTLQQRLAQLEQRPAAAPGPAVDLRPLEGRVAALEQRPAAAGAPDAGLADRMAALDRRLAQAEQAASQAQQEAAQARQGSAQAQQQAAARLARMARLQAAASALEAGRALGEIPGAPPALARFAATPPPSEAGLRLAFPAAAQQARAVSRSGGDDAGGGAGIGERVWQRVRALVTVKEGETVLLGSPAATALGLAGERLGSGDLAGAVAALDGLDPGAAAAMAEWRGQAEALLAARAALAKMAAE